MASAQKCGGVHTKMIRNNSSAGGSTLPVTAVQPSTRRRGAGRPADDDVLRRGALQIAGVDHRVADQRCKGQHRRQHVDPHHQQGHRQQPQQRRKHQRLGRGDPAGRQGSVAGAIHLRIDPGIDHLIDHRRRRCGQENAQVAGQQGVQRHHARHCQQHAHHRRKADQRHHPRLAQLQIFAPQRQRWRTQRYRFSHARSRCDKGCGSRSAAPAAAAPPRHCAPPRPATAGAARHWRCQATPGLPAAVNMTAAAARSGPVWRSA